MGKADQRLPWRYWLGVVAVLLAGLALSIDEPHGARHAAQRGVALSPPLAVATRWSGASPPTSRC
jgi:hypothetical protein